MSDRAARERVFDLTPEVLFRRSDGTVVRLDVLEPMLRSGPITGYAPWDPESKSATRVWAAIGAYYGLMLFDRGTRIAHHYVHQDPSQRAAALKLLKPRGAAS